MSPSRKRNLVRYCALAAGSFAIGAPAVLLAKSLSRERSAAHARTQEIAVALGQRADLVDQFAKKSAELQAQQLEAMSKISSLQRALEEPPTCEDMVPVFKQGVGTLQVAAVREARGSQEEIGAFGKYQVNLVRQLLWLRAVPQWSAHLGHYSGADKIGSMRRVVFREVAPEAGRAMCAWLRCEKWTGGCAFVNDKGVTDTKQEPQEFEPTEDQYNLFIAQHAATPKSPGKPM